MNFDTSLAQWAAQQRARQPVPMRIKTWTGYSVDLSDHPTITVTLTSLSALKLLLRPNLGGLAGAYIEGVIKVEGSLQAAIDAAAAIAGDAPSPKRFKWPWPRRHSKKQDEEAIRYHYDVSNDFYKLWLDHDLVYSCAYFRTGEETIDEAQAQKLDHICKKLRLKPGDRFLDIGCGWGALIRHAAKHYGVDATGITISDSQYALATERIQAAGLADRCRVLRMDYRDLQGEGLYDKIASVGMYEHVGIKNLPLYFATIRRLLAEGGIVMNHGIVSPDWAHVDKGLDAGDFIDRYVFPHGELPTLAGTVHAMANQDLEVHDVECLRPHYALTLFHWSARLEAHQAQAEQLVGDRRYRIWLVYMLASAMNFERGGNSIYQVVATKQTVPALAPMPWSREPLYIPDAPAANTRMRKLEEKDLVTSN